MFTMCTWNDLKQICHVLLTYEIIITIECWNWEPSPIILDEPKVYPILFSYPILERKKKLVTKLYQVLASHFFINKYIMVRIGSRGRRTPRQGMRVSLQSLINIKLFYCLYWQIHTTLLFPHLHELFWYQISFCFHAD